MRGEVNPADIFTKHLQGQERVEGLLQLFGCVFREGRPEAAPQLKRGEEIQLLGEEAERLAKHLDSIAPHDAAILPHEYPEEDWEDMFPRATVAEPLHDDQEEHDNWDLRPPTEHPETAPRTTNDGGARDMTATGTNSRCTTTTVTASTPTAISASTKRKTGGKTGCRKG